MDANHASAPQTGSTAETYEHYLAAAIAHPFTRVLLEYASPRAGERVLDVACGTGSVARHVAPFVGNSGKMVALDVKADRLRVARTLPMPAAAVIEWLEGDATRLELPDGSFDLVVCQQSLQFFGDRAAAMRGDAASARGQWSRRHQRVAGARTASAVWGPVPGHCAPSWCQHRGTGCGPFACGCRRAERRVARRRLSERRRCRTIARRSSGGPGTIRGVSRYSERRRQFQHLRNSILRRVPHWLRRWRTRRRAWLSTTWTGTD